MNERRETSAHEPSSEHPPALRGHPAHRPQRRHRRRCHGLLAACGGSDGTETTPGNDTNETSEAPSSSAEETPSGSTDGGAGGLVETAKVPVGEGVILKDQKIVVTQPTKGDFKAFTAVCTHQACLVDKVENGTIMCPCHGSQYSVKDGSVTGGPAPKALAAIAVKVDGDRSSRPNPTSTRATRRVASLLVGLRPGIGWGIAT